MFQFVIKPPARTQNTILSYTHYIRH